MSSWGSKTSYLCKCVLVKQVTFVNVCWGHSNSTFLPDLIGKRCSHMVFCIQGVRGKAKRPLMLNSSGMDSLFWAYTPAHLSDLNSQKLLGAVAIPISARSHMARSHAATWLDPTQPHGSIARSHMARSHRRLLAWPRLPTQSPTVIISVWRCMVARCAWVTQTPD